MKKITHIAFFLIVALCANAQPNNDKIASHRVAFITQRLNLTPEEAQQFWPVFNQFSEKMQQIRQSAKPDKPLEDMTEADTEKLILADFDRDTRELELKKEYYQKLKKVIPIKKVAKLYRAERDFKAMLLERIQQNRENKKQLRKERN